MKCSNCGELVKDNNICPKCGALNMPLENKPIEENMVNDALNALETESNLEKTEMLNLDEVSAPPKLDVNDEANVQTTAKDISVDENTPTYGEVEKEVDEKTEIEHKVENFDIKIPEVTSPVDKDSGLNDGTAPSISDEETIGDIETLNIDENSTIKNRINLKGNKSLPMPILIIGGVTFLIVGLVLGKFLFSKNYCAPVINNEQKVNVVADGKNHEAIIDYYKLQVPDSFLYDKSNKGLSVYNEGASYRIFIRSESGLYSDMVAAKTSIKETLKEQGISILSVKELKIGDNAFLTFEGTSGTHNQLIAFSDAKKDRMFYIEIVDINNKFNYDALDVAADILTSAKYINQVSPVEKLEVNDISKVAIKASREYKSLK